MTPSDDNYFYKYYKPTPSFIANYGRSKADGAPHGSGRYPLGSGKDPYQRKWKGNKDFEYDEPKKKGLFYNKEQRAQIKEEKKVNPLKSKYRYSDMENDVYLKKGTEFKRLHHPDSPNPTDLQKSRTYASMNPNTFIADGNFGQAISTLKTKKNTIVAGQKSIDRMLMELGNAPMADAMTYKNKMMEFNLDKNDQKLTRPDFVMRGDDELAKKFIAKAKSEGYGGTIDIWDAKTEFSPTATIFFDDVMEKVGDEPVSNFKKREAQNWENKHEKYGKW